MRENRGIWLVVVIVILLLLVSCGGTSESGSFTQRPATTTPRPEPRPAPTPKPAPTPTPAPKTVTALDEYRVLEILQRNFTDSKVKLEGEVFQIVSTDTQMIIELANVALGDANALKDWKEFVESFKGLSKSVNNSLPGYAVAFMNPADDSKVLLLLLNGLVLFNFAD